MSGGTETITTLRRERPRGCTGTSTRAYQRARLCAMIIRADQIDGYLATSGSCPAVSRRAISRVYTPHTPRVHARHPRILGFAPHSFARMADSLVKSRFAQPISRFRLNFCRIPDHVRPGLTLRFRREIPFCSIEGMISFCFLYFILFYFFFRRGDLSRVTFNGP